MESAIFYGVDSIGTMLTSIYFSPMKQISQIPTTMRTKLSKRVLP